LKNLRTWVIGVIIPQPLFEFEIDILRLLNLSRIICQFLAEFVFGLDKMIHPLFNNCSLHCSRFPQFNCKFDSTLIKTLRVKLRAAGLVADPSLG